MTVFRAARLFKQPRLAMRATHVLREQRGKLDDPASEVSAFAFASCSAAANAEATVRFAPDEMETTRV